MTIERYWADQDGVYESDDGDYINYADYMKLEAENATLVAENETLKADAGRLDFMQENFTMVSNHALNLPHSIYFGHGQNKTIREAIDVDIKGD